MSCLFRLLALSALLSSSAAVHAWSDHASLLWPLVRTMPALQQTTVPVETLDEFVAAEKGALEALLAAQEVSARDRTPYYAPRPDELRFDAGADDLRSAFLAAIRVNPRLPYRLYRQRMVEDREALAEEVLQYAELTFLSRGTSTADTVYIALKSGDRVQPGHVVASASDEPDFGMDIGLFEDNGTDFGARYGFGKQSFGNPNLDYGSQAPFHMGFYHLNLLTRKAQPSLLRTYPAWRINLYRELARLAFETGHDYWGWRFTGWGLHYIGDLTQPYHTQPLPRVNTFKALWLVARRKTPEAIQLVSNRHGVLESYQYQRVREPLLERDWESPVLAAIASAGMRREEVFDENTVRRVLTRDSVDVSARLDRTLEKNMPSRYVSDPSFEWTGSGEESAIVATVARERGLQAVAALDAEVVLQMKRFSRFARMWIDDALLTQRN